MIELIATTNRLSDKNRRAYNLIIKWNELESKFLSMLVRGMDSCTPLAQCSWALLVMMQTGIRVGNEKSAEGYVSINKYSDHYNKLVKTYGLTTLLKKHCVVRNNKLFLNFIGKKAIKQRFVITESYLVTFYKILTKDKKADDPVLDVDYYEMKKFVKKYVGKKYTVKDFRTAYINKLFISKAEKISDTFTTKKEVNQMVKNVFIETAETVGHTPTVCKTSYVSKHLVEEWKKQLRGIK